MNVEVLGVLEASLDDVISKKRVYVSKNFAESNPLLFQFSTCTHRYHHSQNRLTFPAGYTKHYWSSLVVLEEIWWSRSTTLTNSPPSTNIVSPSTLISSTTSVRAAFLFTNWTIGIIFGVKTIINVFIFIILWMPATLFFAFECSWIYIC